MRKGLLMVAAVAFGLAASVHAAEPWDGSEVRIEANMRFLASDLLEGRGTGERGHEIAAAYVAAQLQQMGIRPGGDEGSYFQRVSMLNFRPADQGRLALRSRGGAAEDLIFGTDYIPRAVPQAADLTVTADAVFVGYGVTAPERGWDDFKGLDLQGKIAVALVGGPTALPGDERAFYGSIKTKQAAAARHGAVGLILLQTPEGEQRRPFARALELWREWDNALLEDDDRGEGAPLLGLLSIAGGEKLFAAAPRALTAVYAVAEKGRPQGFALPAQIVATLRTEVRPLESMNVVGLLEGGDPVLQRELVVISSHLDHLGRKETGEGDLIFNGAMDNAAGVATSLEVAHALVQGSRPRRSIVFLYDTAEEQSMAGSQKFARNPSTPGKLVAEVNLDMPVLTYVFEDVVGFGAERSTMGAVARRAAAGMNVVVSPDPVPEEGLFTRSDHYSFVEQGVPSIYFVTGFGGDGGREFLDFAARHYHQPSDDLSLPIHFEAGAKFARLNYEVVRAVANDPDPPRWLPGDFFAERFAANGGPAAKRP